MYEIPFSLSEEAFLLSCVQEVIKVWSSHGQANLNLSVKDGHAAVHLGFQLGNPRDAHVLAQQPDQPQYKYKSPARKEKDRIRATAHHQSKLHESARAAPAMMQQKSPAAASADTQVPSLNPTKTIQTLQNPKSTAASAPAQPTLSTSTAASANTSYTAYTAVSTSILTIPTTAAPAYALNTSAADSACSLNVSTAVSASSIAVTSAVPALTIITAASAVATSPSSMKQLKQEASKPPKSQTCATTPTSNKTTLRLLYAKADRLTENFTLNEKIAYSGCQRKIEDEFWETVKVDPKKFIIGDKIDEIKLKETYKSTARSFGVRIW